MKPANGVGAGIVIAAFALGCVAYGMLEGVDFVMDENYNKDPPRCVDGLIAKYRWQTGPTDDEGASKMAGILENRGWEYIEIHHNRAGYLVEAACHWRAA